MNALLRYASPILFVAVIATFGVLSPKFMTADNALNILVQSAPVGIVTIGMTFVLLTASVDLSVGAIMFLAAAIAGKMLQADMPLSVALGAMLIIGVTSGGINAAFIARLRLAPFVVTLAFLFIGRGVALTITQTRAMNLPESFLRLGSARIVGVPLPLLVFGMMLLIAHATLTRTPFGRQLYALGHNPVTACKAGLNTSLLLASVFLISGFCAALGAILSLAQLGAVSPKFGEAYEFKAIAAAVLGGASLFGGRGTVLPGTLLGVVLIQSVEAGLVILNADPYLYPIITAAIIFIAVLIDSGRNTLLERLGRRRIRNDSAQA